MTFISLALLCVPAIMLFGYQSFLEAKGINDPTLAISLYKTSIILDIAVKLLLFCFIDDVDTFILTCSYANFGFALYFFVRLSLNIPKKSLRNYRKFPLNTNYTLLSLKVIAWGIISISFNIFIILFGWDFEDPVIYVYCVFLIIMVASYLLFAAKSLIRLDRLKYSSTRSLNALSNNNSPIVLLRSFKIDSNPTITGKVFDETICENLDLNSNPIISLANPDEILPSGGSLKIQAKDSEWKEVIKEVLKNCRAVVIVEGLSDGLHWEISQLKQYLSHKQLFVLVPSKTFRELAWCYDDNAGTGLYAIIRNFYNLISKCSFSGRKNRNRILNEIWANFSLKLQLFGINTPKNFPGNDCLLSFDEEWNSIQHPNLHRMNQKLSYIVSQTNKFNNSDFDYPKLGQRIATFEVNGFLDEREITPFKQFVDKCNRAGRIIALVCFILFFIVMLIPS